MSSHNPDRVSFADELEATIDESRECVQIEFEGSIENEISTDRVETLEADYLILDLEGVEHTTSFGIKQWIKLLNAIDADYYCFTRVQPPIVHQFNMVYDFSGEGDLVSLYLPYVCPDCRDEFKRLVDLRDNYTTLSNFEVPDADCPACGATGEFDDVPQFYLEYVTQQGPPNVPDPVGRILDGDPEPALDPEERAERSPFRLQKEVVGEVTALWASGYLDREMHLERIAEGLEEPLVMVCSELEGLEIEAFKHFQQLVDGELLLARISLDILEELTDDTEAISQAAPVTTIAPVYCIDCDWDGERELELTALLDPTQPAVDNGCPECFGDLKAAVSTHERRLYAAFDPPELAQDVASYLTHCETHPAQRRESNQFDKVVGSSFGRYTLLRRIGTGGMAEIFLAKQEGAGDFERTVVIKRLQLEKSTVPNLITSFEREAKIASRLTHPNVVQVTDFGQTDQFYYMAMEYVDGPDLREVLAALADRGIHMPVEFALFVILQISDALRAAHNLTDDTGEPTPIVHRDISPHNILVSRHGTPKLTDFGIARIESELEGHSDKVVQGKIPYFPPEVLQPELGPVDGRTDIYSLGTVFYQCVTGRKPFRGENRAERLKSIVTEAPPRPTEVREELSPTIEHVLKRSMAKRPEARYSKIEEMQDDLEEVLDQYSGVTERRFGAWVVEVMSSDEAVRGPERTPADDSPTRVEGDLSTGAEETGQEEPSRDSTTDSLPVKALVYRADDTKRTRDITQVATAAVDDVDVIESLDELATEPGSYDVVLVDIDALDEGDGTQIVDTFETHHRDHRLLAYCDSRVRNRLDLLLGELGLTNLVAYNGELRSPEVLTTLQKVVRGDIFGLEKYFSWGADFEEHELTRTGDIKRLSEAAEEFLDDSNTSQRLLRSFTKVTEELASNALYNAPVDAEGERRFAHLSRAEEVELEPHETADVRFCYDGRRAAVSVRDPFGSVSVDEVTDYLGKPFVTEEEELVDVESEGGAGLGLYQSFEQLSHLILNVSPGEATEFIGLLQIGDRYSDLANHPKSFNVFVADRDETP